MNDFNVFIDDLPLWSAPFGLKLLDILVFRENICVLDLGCGEGFPVVEIAARFGTSSRFYGLDPLAGPLQRFNLKKHAYRLPTVQAVQGVAEELPFSSQSIDLIVSNNGINNVKDLGQALKECRRVIKTGGQMVISVNTEQTMKEFYSVLEQVLKERDMGGSLARMKAQIEGKRPSREKLETLLNTSGFTVNQILKDEFVMKFLNAETMLDHYLIHHFFLNGWKEIVNKDKVETVFEQVKARLDIIAAKKGHICLSIPYMVLDCTIRQHTIKRK